MDRPPAPHRRRPTPALVGAGVLVIALGFGLPRLLTTSGPAEPSAEVAVEAPPDGPGLGTAVARMAGCLVVVCGLTVGVGRLVRPPGAAAGSGMEVAAALPLGGGCVVHLVLSPDGRRLLVGTDRGGVKALVELPGPPPDPTPTVVGPVRLDTPASTGYGFAAVLSRLQRAG